MPSAPFQPRRILVTGAKGFVGTYFRVAAAERWPDAEIFALAKDDEASSGFVAADLLDRQAMLTAVATAKPDLVVHLAAQASVARGAQETGDTWAVNVSGSLNLATAVAQAAPTATVLVASSSEVYGASFLAGPVRESSALNPMNAYARSKAVAERLLAEILPDDTRLLIARPFNHTGPGQSEDFVLPSFVGQVVRIEAEKQPPRLEVGNLDVARDFLDVRDVIDAYLAMIEATPRLPTRFTCNIASETVQPLRAHVETLRRLSRRDFEIVVSPDRLRPVDLRTAAGDASLLRAITGWAPQHDISATLETMLETARKAWRTREDSNL